MSYRMTLSAIIAVLDLRERPSRKAELALEQSSLLCSVRAKVELSGRRPTEVARNVIAETFLICGLSCLLTNRPVDVEVELLAVHKATLNFRLAD